MAHAAKYAKTACGCLTRHYERAKNEKGEYYKFGNEEIDTTRTHLNYNLAPQPKRQLEFIKERLSEVYCMKRDDVNVMCSWVVTAPKELPKEREREFFERSYKFLEERYGKENVISSYVHMDETSPHMHFAFIPVVYDEKKKRYKVSAKEVINRGELKAFHGDLQAEMDRFCEAYENEFECNVLNGATDNGNLSIEKMKANEIEARNEIELEFLQEMIERSNEECGKLEDAQIEQEAVAMEIKYLKAEKDALKGEIEALESKLEALEQNDQTMIAKFISSSQVKPLFERFCEEMRKIMERSKAERQERKGKYGMEYFRNIIKRDKGSSLANRQGEVPFGRQEKPRKDTGERE